MVILERMKRLGVIPVIELAEATKVVPLGRALLEGGINMIDITYRSKAATGAIRLLRAEVPEMIIGAGTVLTKAQLEEAVEAGAEFITSPGFDPDMIRAAKAEGVPIFPGIATASELMSGVRMGLDRFVVWPADYIGGQRLVTAMHQAFNQVEFFLVGGVREATLAQYLDLPGVFAVGGTWIATPPMIAENRFAEITRKAKVAVEIASAMRV